ncbi:MAG: hypothetical protein Q7S29_00760 [Candidatus Peribacter sp.]|nr:hypothetical protein [Candidatus Peribacter sp.]
MPQESRDDVNYLVVGEGILNNTVGILDVAGKGDVPGLHGGKIVSLRAKQATWERLNPRIRSGEFKNTAAIWAAAREEFERTLQDPDGPATHSGEASMSATGGNGQSTNPLHLPDDGEDMPKTHRGVLLGAEGPND